MYRAQPSKLRITSECGSTILPDGESLCYAVVEITDEEGHFIPWAEDELTAEYTGAGALPPRQMSNPAWS